MVTPKVIKRHQFANNSLLKIQRITWLICSRYTNKKLTHLHLHIPYFILSEAIAATSDAVRRPTANISQLEQFAPRLSHKAVAKEHKKSESYQLTRSLRSAVLSHSSCSYVTCRSGFQFTFAREPLLPPTMLIAGVACVLGKFRPIQEQKMALSFGLWLLDDFYGSMFCGAFVQSYHFSRCTCVQIVRLGLQDELLLLR